MSKLQICNFEPKASYKNAEVSISASRKGFFRIIGRKQAKAKFFSARAKGGVYHPFRNAVSFAVARKVLLPHFRIISRGAGNTNTTLFGKGVVFLMQGKVEICGVNTASLPVLKSAETRALLEKTRGGDAQAREKLISGNLRLLFFLAKVREPILKFFALF